MRIRGWSIQGAGRVDDPRVADVPPGLTVVDESRAAQPGASLELLAHVLFGAADPGAALEAAPAPALRFGRVVLADAAVDVEVERDLDGRAPPRLRWSNARAGASADGLRRLLGGADARLFGAVFTIRRDDVAALATLDADGRRAVCVAASLAGAGRAPGAAARWLRTQAARRLGGDAPHDVERLVGELETLRPRLNAARQAMLAYGERRAEAERLDAAVEEQRAILARTPGDGEVPPRPAEHRALGELRAALEERAAHDAQGELNARALRERERAMQALDAEPQPSLWLGAAPAVLALAGASAAIWWFGHAPPAAGPAAIAGTAAAASAAWAVRRRHATAAAAARRASARRTLHSEMAAARRARDAAWRRAAQLADDIARAAAELALPPHPSRAEIEARARALTRAEAAPDGRAARQRRVDELVAAHRDARAACQTLEESAEIASLERTWAALTAELDEAVRDWQVLIAAEGLIDEARRTMEQTRRPAVLAAAAAFLTAASGGRYVDIEPEDARESLRVVERDGRRRDCGALGEHTAELYLSLRLGLARALGSDGVALPVVIDDALAAFAGDAARAVAEALGAFAQGQQVLCVTRDRESREWLVRDGGAQRVVEP